MRLISGIRKLGAGGYARHLARQRLWVPYHRLRTRGAPEYPAPVQAELERIADVLTAQGIALREAGLAADEFQRFRREWAFPDTYTRTRAANIDEKLLEHFIAWHFCGLGSFGPGDIYLDIACSGSPWSSVLHRAGVCAWSLDLRAPDAPDSPDVAARFLRADATAMPFDDGGVRAASLQCALELFGGDSDSRLIGECARVLAPGGRLVVAPLYLHTHACGYSSPEYFDRGYADPGAKAYVRQGVLGVAWSRKYTAQTLQQRVLEPARHHGLEAVVYRLGNAGELGQGIYCHFILVLTRVAGPETGRSRSE